MKRILSLAVSLVILGPWAMASAADSAATIYRDEFGIPHIFAPTLEDAAYAAGYAQAEDRLEELLEELSPRQRHDGRGVRPRLVPGRPPPARHAARRDQPGPVSRDQPQDARGDRVLSRAASSSS